MKSTMILKFPFSSIKKFSTILLFIAVALFYVALVNSNRMYLLQPDIYSYSMIVKRNLETLKNSNFYMDSSKLVPFIRMKAHYRTAPQYNLSACIVEKAMCSVIQGLFCYLYDSERFVEHNRSITKEPWTGRFCYNLNEASTSSQRHEMLPQIHENIFVVRDPVERFLSGFTDKCFYENSTCYGCNGDVFCAVEKLREDLYNISKTFPDYKNQRGHHIYMNYESQHMAPMTWYCDLWDEPSNYLFLRYGEDRRTQENMLKNLLKVLKDHKVEDEKIEYIKRSLSASTKHTTKHSSDRKRISDSLRRSKLHMEMLMDIYHYDYLVFGIPKPSY